MKNNGCFKKGHVAWNKGMKGFNPSPETTFKEGELVGAEHPSWTGGEQVMKSDCTYLWDGCNKRVRRPRKIYEQHYGKIPDGYVVIHKDGDRYNDTPENLLAISRAENLKRNNDEKINRN